MLEDITVVKRVTSSMIKYLESDGEYELADLLIETEYNEKYNVQIAKKAKEIEEHKNARLLELEDLKQEKQTRVETLTAKSRRCSASLTAMRIALAVVIVAFAVFSTIKLWKKEWFLGALGAIPVVGAFIFMIINTITQKRIDLSLVMDKILSLLQKKRKAQLESYNEEISAINEAIEEIDEKIDLLKQQGCSTENNQDRIINNPCST